MRRKNETTSLFRRPNQVITAPPALAVPCSPPVETPALRACGLGTGNFGGGKDPVPGGDYRDQGQHVLHRFWGPLGWGKPLFKHTDITAK